MNSFVDNLTLELMLAKERILYREKWLHIDYLKYFISLFNHNLLFMINLLIFKITIQK